MIDFEVKSEGGPYTVEFVEKVADVSAMVASPTTRIVCDPMVISKCYPVGGYSMVFSEHTKNLDGVDSLCCWLANQKSGKDTVLVAVGGGVVQDVATMTAAIYKRGIKLVLVPTTLMAQADSCIGAKCGLNIGVLKNQVGCFYSPTRVIVCHEFLKTLTDDHIASGYGEILKLLLIGCGHHFLKACVDCGGLRNPRLLEIVYRSLKSKKAIIEADEKERGKLRVLLNYGHTFAHALEANQRVPHGLAVAWGIDVANFINCRVRRLLAEEIYLEVKDFIRKYLPFRIDHEYVKAEDLMVPIRSDKKMRPDNSIDLVVMDRPGQMHLCQMEMPAVEAALRQYLETENVYA